MLLVTAKPLEAFENAVRDGFPARNRCWNAVKEAFLLAEGRILVGDMECRQGNGGSVSVEDDRVFREREVARGSQREPPGECFIGELLLCQPEGR